MKEQLNVLEKQMSGFYKNAPKLPEGAIKWIVKYNPILALVFGVLQLLSTVSLWNLGHRANDIVNVANTYAQTFGVKSSAPGLNVFYWVAVIFVGISGVMLLLAYPGLKEKKKIGWDWLFYGGLVNLGYGIFSVFFDSYYGGGISRLIGALIGSLITFWILFQIRDSYTKHKSDTTSTS
jgi:hypothetical protein